MARVHNFSAGPASLPRPVLEQMRDELIEYGDTGMSVMEMSHRSPAFHAVADDAEAALRRIMRIPDSYRVLFLQGGATLQFAGIPLNLMRRGRAGYLVSGVFAKKAWEEARRYGDAIALASSEATGFDRIPDFSAAMERAGSLDLDYAHICQNNTVYGTQYRALPDFGDVPLVADVSSCFLSMPLEVERYGMLYAGAQKNAGAAGTTVLIIRDDLLADGPASPYCPSYLDYRLQADKGSMLNTPNTFGIYACGKVLHWVEQAGGLEAMRERNAAKARILYGLIDASGFYRGIASPGSRSISNITFRTPSPELDAALIDYAKERGIVNIKGHRAVGGLRASIYNAVTLESVEALAACLHDFEASRDRRSV